jgi:hypothetical protein
LDVKVLADVKHVFAKGFGPAPDISVIRGVRDPLRKRRSFHIREEGVVPCLVIEVVSPFDARIRRTDEVDKVALYQRHGVPEYVMVYPPGQATGPRFQLKGYRLDAAGRYRTIEPDAQGRLLSETTELRFGVSPEGDRIQIFNSRTGERLRSPTEEVEAERAARLAAEERAARETEARRAERAAREAAENKAWQEAEARKTAEEELKRLRSELERLKAPGA